MGGAQIKMLIPDDVSVTPMPNEKIIEILRTVVDPQGIFTFIPGL